MRELVVDCWAFLIVAEEVGRLKLLLISVKTGNKTQITYEFRHWLSELYQDRFEKTI